MLLELQPTKEHPQQLCNLNSDLGKFALFMRLKPSGIILSVCFSFPPSVEEGIQMRVAPATSSESSGFSLPFFLQEEMT